MALPLRSRVRFALLAIFCLTCPAGAHAAPFADSELFVGRTIKQSAKDVTLRAGAHFQIAPVKAIVQSVVQDTIDAHPESAKLVEYLQYIDTEQMKALANSGQVEEFKKALKAELKAQGKTLTSEQEAVIDAIDSNKLKTMAEIIEVYNAPKETLVFSLEPYVALNLKPVEITARIAIAGFNSDDKTSLELGNLGVEARVGDSYGIGSTVALGWTLGAAAYAPTGTTDADTVSLSNILATPRYLHDYFTVTGFGVLGAELAFVDLTVRGEYVDMRATGKGGVKELVTGKPLTDMRYLNVGAGALVDLGFLGVTAEIDGLVNLENAPVMDNVWLATLGLRTYLKVAQLGAAVQLPLVQPGEDAYASFGGANLGSPADFNFLLNAQVNF